MRLAPESGTFNGPIVRCSATRCDRLHAGQHHLFWRSPLPRRSRRQREPFASSTWIVQKGDRDLILVRGPANPPATARAGPEFFEGLANSKTIVLNGEDHDVFGDGTVVIKSTPGHTPGHQSLFLKLANTGNVRLAAISTPIRRDHVKKIPSFDTNRSRPPGAERWSKSS